MTTYAQLVARIDEYAQNLEPRRAVIGAFTLPFWVVGFVVGVIVRGLWLVGAYIWAAAAVGYTTARGR